MIIPGKGNGSGDVSVTDDFDVDFGIKAGLNRTETDMTLLAGIAWRF